MPIRLLLASLFLILCTTVSHAGVEVVVTDPGRAAHLRFELRAGSGPERVESALLSGDWGDAQASAALRLADGSLVDVATGFTLKRVAIGRMDALQVVVDPAQLEVEPPVDGRLEVWVQGTAAAVPKAGGTKVPPSVASLFADKPSKVFPAAKRKSVDAPGYLGTDRIARGSRDSQLLAITFPELQIADFTEVATLQLNHHGSLVPIAGVLADRLWVYAPRRQTLTDVTDSIFATRESSSPSPAIASRPAFQTLTPQGVEMPIRRRLVHAPRNTYDRSSFEPVGERFYVHGIQTNQTRTVNLEFNDVLTSTGMILRFEAHGRNISPPTPDHYTFFTVGGVTLPTVSWKGRTAYFGEQPVVLPSVNVGNPLVVTQAVPPGSPFGGGTDLQALKSFELEWIGQPRLPSSGRLALSVDAAGAPRVLTVGGFADGTAVADIVILDVTDPYAPVRIDSPATFSIGGGRFAVEFEVGAPAAELHIQLLDTAESPLFVAPATMLPSLPSGRELEGVFVRPAEFGQALGPLEDARGSGWITLDVQAAYDAFNGGQESSEAIRRALAWLMNEAESTVLLPSVLLVGHGSLDRKNYTNRHSGPQVPSWLELGMVLSGGVQNENPTDFDYGMLFGEDNFADAAVSRIPAKSVADVQVAVARQLRHMEIAEALSRYPREALFVTDDDNIFLADTQVWINFWQQTGRGAQRLDVDPVTEPGGLDGQAELAIIKTALESGNGLAMIMYMGHGNTDRWSGHRILQTSDVANINTEDRWPFVATFTCLNSFYAQPGATTLSLGEAWIVTPNRGAIAALAPSGVGLYGPQRNYALTMLQQIAKAPLERPATIGELMVTTQNAYLTQYPILEETARSMLLFGDPAAALTIGEPTAAINHWLLY
jgi:hypothetical protein